MFAYCNNSPVTHADSQGNLPGGIINPNAMTRNGGSSTHAIPDKKRREQELREQARELFNENEEAVLYAEHYAFYKGALVIKIPAMGSNAFSAGVILMGSDAIGASMVRHEYGHFVHLSQIGWDSYLVNVVFPSLVGFWSNVPMDEYYSQPWEYIAEILGNVERTNYTYAPYANEQAFIYWLYTLLA